MAEVERVDNIDSFLAQEKGICLKPDMAQAKAVFSVSVCGLLWSGVVAIFGPQDDISSMHVQSICENYDIPHIEARPDHDWHRSDLTINLHPSPYQLSSVYIDLVRAWNWQSFAIIYEANDGKSSWFCSNFHSVNS